MAKIISQRRMERGLVNKMLKEKPFRCINHLLERQRGSGKRVDRSKRVPGVRYRQIRGKVGRSRSGNPRSIVGGNGKILVPMHHQQRALKPGCGGANIQAVAMLGKVIHECGVYPHRLPGACIGKLDETSILPALLLLLGVAVERAYRPPDGNRSNRRPFGSGDNRGSPPARVANNPKLPRKKKVRFRQDCAPGNGINHLGSFADFAGVGVAGKPIQPRELRPVPFNTVMREIDAHNVEVGIGKPLAGVGKSAPILKALESMKKKQHWKRADRLGGKSGGAVDPLAIAHWQRKMGGCYVQLVHAGQSTSWL